MNFVANANAAPRAYFVAGSDRQARVGILAGPYDSPVEAGSRFSITQEVAAKRGLLARFRVFGLAEGPSDTPTYLGPI